MVNQNILEKTKQVVRILEQKKQTISTMESCTGGGFVNLITDIEGASDVLHYSAITYSDESKIKMGVSSDIIDQYTVYSVETAQEMSHTICLFADSHYGVGITGMLNCSDPHYPLNNPHRIYISIYHRDTDIFYNEYIDVYSNSRVENKEAVLDKVVTMMLEIIS